MNELEELEQEGLDEQLLEVGGTADLPNVPATELPAAPGQFCKLNCRDYISLESLILHFPMPLVFLSSGHTGNRVLFVGVVS